MTLWPINDDHIDVDHDDKFIFTNMIIYYHDVHCCWQNTISHLMMMMMMILLLLLLLIVAIIITVIVMMMMMMMMMMMQINIHILVIFSLRGASWPEELHAFPHSLSGTSESSL